jgi:hypothetical protein
MVWPGLKMSKQMLILFAILIVLITGCAPDIPEISGIAYYVDCESGDDIGANEWLPEGK